MELTTDDLYLIIGTQHVLILTLQKKLQEALNAAQKESGDSESGDDS